MSLLHNSALRSRLSFVFCLLLVVGLYMTHYFRALPSICIIALAVLGLWEQWASGQKQSLRALLPFIGIGCILLVHLVSFLYTEPHNYAQFQKELVIKSPLVVLSLAFALLPFLSAKRYYSLYYLYVVLTVIAALISLVYYLLNREFVHQEYLRSHVMFTVVNYVRFSLLLAFGTVVAFVLYRRRFYLINPELEPKLLLGMSVFLFVFMHVLAVRSGLAAFYLLAGLYAAYLFLVKRQFKQALLIGLVLALSPVISYYTLQTFRNKFYNTVDDVGRVESTKEANNYSIVGRVYSYKTALEVIQKNPVIGVGIADLKEEIDQIYARDYPNIKPSEYKMPHNQFLYYLAAFGALGLLLIMACFYYPLLRYFRLLDPLFLAHYFIISVSFMFEFTLETQMGITFTLLFILLPLYFYRTNRIEELKADG